MKRLWKLLSLISTPELFAVSVVHDGDTVIDSIHAKFELAQERANELIFSGVYLENLWIQSVKW